MRGHRGSTQIHSRSLGSRCAVLYFAGYFALGVANHSVKLTETKLGTTAPPKSWGIDSDTLLEQYELNGTQPNDLIQPRPTGSGGCPSARPRSAVQCFSADLACVLCVAAGDTVGVAFDQSDEKVLRIYHNGQYLSGQDVRGMKGETWPVVIVAGGASLEVSALPRTQRSSTDLAASLSLSVAHVHLNLKPFHLDFSHVPFTLDSSCLCCCCVCDHS